MAELILPAGWEDPLTEIRRRLLLSIASWKGHGKTTFALGAPGPVCYYKLETGDEGVIEPIALVAKEAGKQIKSYRVYYNHLNYEQVFDDFMNHLVNTCTAFRSAGVVGTIIFDTFTEVWELSRFYHFRGRLNQIQSAHTPVNVDMKEIIRLVEGAGVNGIFLHRMAEFEKRQYMAGWSSVEYEMQVMLRLNRIDGESGAPDRFTGLVEECRQNGKVKNLILEGNYTDPLPQIDTESWRSNTGGVFRPLTFDYLLRLVHG